MALNSEIGKLIASHRKRKKMTQERLAALADLHPDYIGKLERGERAPSVESLLGIIRQLDVKYADFFSELESHT